MNTDSEKPGSGTAGNSARRRADENSKNLDNGKSWKKGAIGEEYAGVVIESLCTEYGFKFLHDRKIPGSSANIDHILITNRGVFVIDTKNYEGAVRVKESGGLLTPLTETLFVGNRNQTKLVLGVKKQVELVVSATSQMSFKVPVFGVLAFYNANWPIFFKPKKVDGVLINSKGIEAAILEFPVLIQIDTDAVYTRLEKTFLPK